MSPKRSPRNAAAQAQPVCTTELTQSAATLIQPNDCAWGSRCCRLERSHYCPCYRAVAAAERVIRRASISTRGDLRDSIACDDYVVERIFARGGLANLIADATLAAGLGVRHYAEFRRMILAAPSLRSLSLEERWHSLEYLGLVCGESDDFTAQFLWNARTDLTDLTITDDVLVHLAGAVILWDPGLRTRAVAYARATATEVRKAQERVAKALDREYHRDALERALKGGAS